MTATTDGYIERCLSDDILYGDDFDRESVSKWYEEETEGYADLGACDRERYRYSYHAWNQRHGFAYLRDGSFTHVLGFGSAYGDELLPVARRASRITIMDPSQAFQRDAIAGVPVSHIPTNQDGLLPFGDDTFDLITCLGVLHHIPNVTAVVREFARTLQRGGRLLLREPIVPMGDWRTKRVGLTRNERGIPLPILRSIAVLSGLRLINESLCGFSPAESLYRLVRPDFYNSRVFVAFDVLLSQAFAWNANYHPRSIGDYFRPTSAFLVLEK